jgi:hypothetical protein
LNAKYKITSQIAWQTQLTDENRRGIVGEYLALERAHEYMGSHEEEGEELQYWTNVHFIGNLYAGQQDEAPESVKSDAGSELDLMKVHVIEDQLHCLGVGNVKAGHGSKLAGGARKQNDSAIELLASFTQNERRQLGNKKWAHVDYITYVVDSQPKTLVDRTKLSVGNSVQKVTIGASSAPGQYDKRLGYTADQIMEMARYLTSISDGKGD